MSNTLSSQPETLKLTVEQYETLVRSDSFAHLSGQIELIRGSILHMNPQGPEHADPIDELQEWSAINAVGKFRIRTEKPITISFLDSCPEPDIAWVTLGRYAERHPKPEEVYLLIEVSYTSGPFDRTQKQQLYAEASIREYWRIDVPSQTVLVHRDPKGMQYLSTTIYKRGDTLFPQCLPEARLRVDTLFVDH